MKNEKISPQKKEIPQEKTLKILKLHRKSGVYTVVTFFIVLFLVTIKLKKKLRFSL